MFAEAGMPVLPTSRMSVPSASADGIRRRPGLRIIPSTSALQLPLALA